MSLKLTSHNPDLQKLQDEGYEVEVRNVYLLLHSIPYVNSKREIAMGILVSSLELNNNHTKQPEDHQVWFAGDQPCNQDGSPILGIGCRSATQTLCEGLKVHHRFSCKPKGGKYIDYFAKMTRYVEIILNQAQAIDSTVKARTYKPVESTEEESVFRYYDAASSRAGIAGLAMKLAMDKVAIVGLGGTGSYVLDLVTKTHAEEIHLFDGDEFDQHNAFRAPGAAPSDILGKVSKVKYYAGIYDQMRRGIFPHEVFLDDETIQQLVGIDFVFLCVDKPAVRKLLSDFLRDQKIPFIDTGMNMEVVEDQQCLVGICRVTMCTPDKSDHFPKHVSLAGNILDELYGSNIQIADLNALNAAMAVIKWKKYCGFYQDCYKEHQSAYAINTHQLTRDEIDG